MAKVGFTTKDGTVVSFTTKKRSTRKNASTAVAVRANGKHKQGLPLHEVLRSAEAAERHARAAVGDAKIDWEPSGGRLLGYVRLGGRYDFSLSVDMLGMYGGGRMIYQLDIKADTTLPAAGVRAISARLRRLGIPADFATPRTLDRTNQYLWTYGTRYASSDALLTGSEAELKRVVQQVADKIRTTVVGLERPKAARARVTATRSNPARKPVKRTTVSRSSKDKATFKFYVVFRGPPKGLNIHAGFATQQAARAYITKKFKGTRRLQVRGRPGLVKSGHNPKVAANWKTFSLAASLKAAPAPRRRKTTTRRNGDRDDYYRDLYYIEEWGRLIQGSNAEMKAGVRNGPSTLQMLYFQRWHGDEIRAAIERYPEMWAAVEKAARRNSGKFEGFSDYEAERTLATSAHVGKDARRRAARREREAQELALLEAERDVREADRRRKKGLTRKIKPVYSREYLEAKGMPRRNGSQLPGLSYGGRNLAARYGSYWTPDPWETCIGAAERADAEARKASYRGDVDEARRLREQRDAWLAQAETYLKKNRGRR